MSKGFEKNLTERLTGITIDRQIDRLNNTRMIDGQNSRMNDRTNDRTVEQMIEQTIDRMIDRTVEGMIKQQIQIERLNDTRMIDIQIEQQNE